MLSGCADPGLAMFHEYVGQYFTPDPTLEELPAGMACPLCGGADVRLWRTTSGDVKCLTRLGISGRRAGRGTAGDPLIPLPGATGRISLGEGAMAIAGPQVAMIITRLLPVRPLPATVEVRFPAKGMIATALADLMRSPPPPPFVVIAFARKAGFRARITVDPGLIHVNGPESYSIDRGYLLEMTTLFHDMPFRDITAIVELRSRMAAGIAAGKDREALAKLATDHPAVLAALRRLPSPASPALTALRRQLDS